MCSWDFPASLPPPPRRVLRAGTPRGWEDAERLLSALEPRSELRSALLAGEGWARACRQPLEKGWWKLHSDTLRGLGLERRLGGEARAAGQGSRFRP